MKIYLVNSFFPSLDKAKEIGKIVLKRKLAACVNINDKIKSFFFSLIIFLMDRSIA